MMWSSMWLRIQGRMWSSFYSTCILIYINKEAMTYLYWSIPHISWFQQSLLIRTKKKKKKISKEMEGSFHIFSCEDEAGNDVYI